MAKGRKKDLILVKETRGTLRKDRLPADMPEASAEGMMPVDLPNARVVAYFELLRGLVAEMGNDSATYGPALSLAALRMDEIAQLTEFIEIEGFTFESEGRNGVQIKANPKVVLRSEAMRHLGGLLAEFGLTPAAIQKVGGGGKKKATNPFTEL